MTGIITKLDERLKTLMSNQNPSYIFNFGVNAKYMVTLYNKVH